jgi:MFS family permease
VTGGAIAAGLAWVAGKYLIQRNILGNGYATTFLVAVVLTTLGLTALALLMVEPIPPTIRDRARIFDRIKDFPKLLSEDRDFMFFMISQTLATAGRVAAPFYILYAGHTIKLSGSNLGLISLAFLGADTATNMIWGLAGDRFGFRATFIGSLFVWVAATALLMGAPTMAAVHMPFSGGGPHGGMMLGAIPLIFISFFGLGAAQSGFLMSSQTMVLEFGARDDMAMRLALTATSQGLMNTIGPLAGGAIAALLGYEVLFSVSIVFLTLALIVLLTVVKEPRFRGVA